MRTGFSLIEIAVIIGLVFGMALPIAHAQEPGDIVVSFHVHPNGTGEGSQSLSIIPPDAQDRILIAGNSTTTITRAALENLCGTVADESGTPTPSPSPSPTGTATPSTPCAAVDLYFQIDWTLQWDSGLEEGCGTFGVCERNVAPVITLEYGGSGNPKTESWGNCGNAGVASGSCTNNLSGTIPAADIDNTYIGTAEWLNEYFEVDYSEYWGGSTFQTSYSIILSTTPILEDCAGQFNIGGVLGSLTLAATNATGINLRTAMGINYPAPGQWYAIQVSGGWKNNGTGPDLRTLAERLGPILWTPLVASPNVECADTGNDTYYLQMTSAGGLYLRVYDTDGNFSDNSGSLNITISSVTAFTRYSNGCELQYQVGNLLVQGEIDASQQNGVVLKSSDTPGTGGSGGAPQPTRYYMLETTGGPANIGFLTWNIDIGLRDHATDPAPANWYEAKTAPFVTCAVILDPVEHVRIFFPADSQPMPKLPITHYYHSIRVSDTGSYSDNFGTIGYRLYEATNMQVTTPGETPGPDGCNQYAHTSAPAIDSVVIQAVADKGTSLPALADKSIYALDVTDGPWEEAGTTDSYSVELSDDNGSTWTDLESYANLLCAASADGEHIEIYIYGAAGKHFKVRVNDTDANFSTNTGSIGMDVFAGYTLINEWVDCSKDFTFTKVSLSDEQRKIPANLGTGKAVVFSSLSGSSSIYALEITDESKWYEDGAESTAGSYLVDISDDGGDSWVPFEDSNALCKEQIGDGDRWRIVIDVGAGGGVGPDPGQPNNRRLRVRDEDGDYLTNTGYVMYQLYKAVATSAPNNGSDTTPAEWVVACNESYARPGGFISWNSIGTILGVNISVPVPMVGEWIDYLRNAIIYYLAWCPQHTAALQSLAEDLNNKEPMESVNTMNNFIGSIKTLIENSQAAGGADANVNVSQEPQLFSDQGNIDNPGGGASGPDLPTSHGTQAWDLFTVWSIDPTNNIWFGGKIDLTSGYTLADLSSMNDYTTFCSAKFYPLFGIVSGTYCSLIALLRYSKTITMLLLVMDLLISCWFLLKYFPGYLKKWINLGKGLS